MSEIRYVMWLIYGYAIWIAAEYAWDWWKNARQRRCQSAAEEQFPIERTEGLLIRTKNPAGPE